jgi:hypothetical protein
MVQDDDRALLGRELAEAVLEKVAIRDHVGRVVGCLAVQRQYPNSRAPSPLGPRFGVTGVDDETVEPCLEARRVAQGRQVAPGAQERLLRGVLGAVVIAKDAVGEAVAAIDRGAGERREGVAIASARPFHEVDLHG